MGLHKFGKRIEGRLHTMFGCLDDGEFAEVTRNGLPEGWVAWHIDERELEEPVSDRVRELRELACVGHWKNEWFFDTGAYPERLTNS